MFLFSKIVKLKLSLQILKYIFHSLERRNARILKIVQIQKRLQKREKIFSMIKSTLNDLEDQSLLFTTIS